MSSVKFREVTIGIIWLLWTSDAFFFFKSGYEFMEFCYGDEMTWEHPVRIMQKFEEFLRIWIESWSKV